MDMLNAMQTFVAVAENHGITAASERLGCSKAIVSRTLSLLEERLDVRLLNRTTRRVSLTEAGSEYLEHCRNILEQNAEIESRFAEKSLEPQGRLRIAVPVTFGSQYIAPLLPKFLEKHGKVQVDLHMSDRYVDIIEEGMDMAIRIGATGSDSLIVRKFAETHHKLAASPALIKKMGGQPQRCGSVEKLAINHIFIASEYAELAKFPRNPLTRFEQVPIMAIQSLRWLKRVLAIAFCQLSF